MFCHLLSSVCIFVALGVCFAWFLAGFLFFFCFFFGFFLGFPGLFGPFLGETRFGTTGGNGESPRQQRRHLLGLRPGGEAPPAGLRRRGVNVGRGAAGGGGETVG